MTMQDRSGETVLVTGATGFLGRHIVGPLLREGYRLRLLVRPTSETGWLDDSLVQLVTGDLTDAVSVRRAMAGCQYVVHAAALFRFWGVPELFERINVEGTAAIADAALEYGVRRVVHISAIAVVGVPPRGDWIDENTVCRPQDDYQRSKLDAERQLLARVEAGGLSAVILRPGAFYGPYGRYGFNRLFIEDPLRGIRIMVGRGQRMTFPVYVPDVARAVCTALRKGRPGEIYNICDRPITHAQVNDLVSPLLDISSRRLNAPEAVMLGLATLMEAWAKITKREPFYPLNLRHYVFSDWRVDNRKAESELGMVYTPISEGLRQTVSWYRGLNLRPLSFIRRMG